MLRVENYSSECIFFFIKFLAVLGGELLLLDLDEYIYGVFFFFFFFSIHIYT